MGVMTDLLERVRRPEYTGENRCWPCTLTNGLLLGLLVVAVARRRNRLEATLLGALGTTALHYRGYVLPYTPKFAPRLVRRLPFGSLLFDHDEQQPSDSLADRATADETDEPPSGEAIVTALLEAGVVVADGEELSLDPNFQAAWRNEMEQLRGRSLEELAATAAETIPAAVETDVGRTVGTPYIIVDVTGDGSGVSTLREPVAIAELAAASALESYIDDEAVRLAAGRPLRTLLAACPFCDESLTVTRQACCGEVTPVGSRPPEKLVCPACDIRVFTFDTAGGRS